jgi:hypothetical protein
MTAALEAVQRQHPLRILITAGTYTAIDNILLELVQHLPQVLPANVCELVRIRAKTQPPNPNVPATVDRVLNRYQVTPAIRTLLTQLHQNQSITIVGATPEQVHNLMQVDGKAQEELFDLLIVDEASQMDVAHTILALPQVPCCALCSIVDDPLPKEIELHPAIPTPLDQLEAVDMAFDWPVRPRQRQSGFDGRIVPLEHIHKVLQFDDIAGATGQQPRVQLLSVTLPDDRSSLLHERLYLH